MQQVEKNWLEWIVFGVSLALVASVLGYLGYCEWTGTDRPPNIRVELGQPEKRGDSFYLPVTLYNDGDKTAEGVRIAVTLQQDGDQQEAEFEAMFLPHHSQRKGEVVFTTDPADADTLTARVIGYRMP